MKNSYQASLVDKVRVFFPQVDRVAFATKPVKIVVTEGDCSTGKKKDAANCAMAVACMRQEKVDGALIRPTTAYLVRGNLATKYEVPHSVRTEIVSFDRHQDFRPGEYQLSAVCPCHTVARPAGKKRGHKMSGKKRVRPLVTHHSEDLRGLVPAK